MVNHQTRTQLQCNGFYLDAPTTRYQVMMNASDISRDHERGATARQHAVHMSDANSRGRRHPIYQMLVGVNGDVYVDNVVWAVFIGAPRTIAALLAQASVSVCLVKRNQSNELVNHRA